MKKTIILVCILSLLVCASSAIADQFKATKVGNIRSGPGTTHSIIGKSEISEQWEISGIEGNWVKIGNDKYIHNSLGSYIKEAQFISKPECPEVDYDAVRKMIQSEYTVRREFTTFNTITDSTPEYRTDYTILMFIASWIIMWILPSILCSVAAERKGLTKWGFFFFSLFFSGILGFLAVIAFPPKTKF